MVMGEYWRKNKRRLLPWVKDWSSTQDHIRYSNNVKDMSYNDWFYCHPSAYSLIYYGTPASAMIMFFLCSFLSWLYGINPLMVISGIIGIIFAGDLVIKIRKWTQIKRTTFYDLYMWEPEPDTEDENNV